MNTNTTVSPVLMWLWHAAYNRLLDALAGRTEPSDVKGTIFVDGQRPPSNFKFMTGYVIQVMLRALKAHFYNLAFVLDFIVTSRLVDC